MIKINGLLLVVAFLAPENARAVVAPSPGKLWEYANVEDFS